MALVFVAQDGVFNPNVGRVRFFALDDGQSVMFSITRDALEDIAGGEDLTDAQLTETFSKHREFIEQRARLAYNAQKPPRNDLGGAIVIEPADLGPLPNRS